MTATNGFSESFSEKSDAVEMVLYSTRWGKRFSLAADRVRNDKKSTAALNRLLNQRLCQSCLSCFVAIGESPEAFVFQDIHPGL